MQSLYYGNTTTSTSRSSPRARDAHNSRHTPIGPSRTRLVNRHNPYATTPSQRDTEGSTLKGQRRNRREGHPRPSTKRSSATTADVAAVTLNGTWEGAPQDATNLRLPEPVPAPHSPGHLTRPPEHASACASTTLLPPPPTTPRLVAQDKPLDEFGLCSFLEYEDNYGPDFFGSFDLDCSTSYPEQATIARGAEEEIPQSTPGAATPLPKPTQKCAGKINLSSLHHKLMRSRGYVPDISLEQLDGVVRRQILRQADALVFEYQAQSREQRKWRGYREPEDLNLLKKPKKKVRFNPCSREGRTKKRSVHSGVDELIHRIGRFQLSA